VIDLKRTTNSPELSAEAPLKYYGRLVDFDGPVCHAAFGCDEAIDAARRTTAADAQAISNYEIPLGQEAENSYALSAAFAGANGHCV
jgi:hypothetical protein